MERQDWDEAATFIHQASLLDPAIVNGPLAMSAVPTSEIPDPPTVYLSQASDALFNLFLREFDAAAKVKDEERITRFFRLFPLIGKENEGLDVYGRFVCGIIAGRSRAAMTQCKFSMPGRILISATSSPVFFAKTLTRLFENIALIVNAHTPLVDRFYGTGKMVRVIQRLQGECDRQGGIILDSLWDDRNVQRRVSHLRKRFNISLPKQKPMLSISSYNLFYLLHHPPHIPEATPLMAASEQPAHLPP
jgi:conserved oligomeric Golgi complex subunit 4